MKIDLKPALSEEQLDRRLLRDFEENQNKQFKNALCGLLAGKDAAGSGSGCRTFLWIKK